MTLSGPVASFVGGKVVETWKVTSFSASGSWTLTLSGGWVLTANIWGSAPIMLTVGGAAGV